MPASGSTPASETSESATNHVTTPGPPPPTTEAPDPAVAAAEETYGSVAATAEEEVVEAPAAEKMVQTPAAAEEVVVETPSPVEEATETPTLVDVVDNPTSTPAPAQVSKDELMLKMKTWDRCALTYVDADGETVQSQLTVEGILDTIEDTSEVLGDKELAIAVVSVHGYALKYFQKANLHDDLDVAKAAVTFLGTMGFQFISDRLQKDRELVLTMWQFILAKCQRDGTGFSDKLGMCQEAWSITDLVV